MSEARQLFMEVSLAAQKQSIDGVEALNTFRGPQGPQGDPGSIDNLTINGKKAAPVDGENRIDLTPSDVGALPSGGTANDSVKLGGKVPEYYLQHRNLLDNSDWRIKANIVNRKNVTIVESYKDCIDRWGVEGGGTLEVLDDSLQLTTEEGAAYVGFNQNLENYSLMKGKTYTLAFNADGVVRVVPFVMGGTGAGNANGDFKIYSVDGLNMLIRFHGQSTKLYWAALYEGHHNAETIPPYVPKGYANELLACEVAEKGNIFGMDLLYQNASPGSGFGGQHVKLGNLSAYTQVEIEFRHHGSNLSSVFRKCRVGMQGFSEVMETYEEKLYIFTRTFEVKESYIAFGDGWQTVDNNTSEANERLVPVRIYGIKGVLA